MVFTFLSIKKIFCIVGDEITVSPWNKPSVENQTMGFLNGMRGYIQTLHVQGVLDS